MVNEVGLLLWQFPFKRSTNELNNISAFLTLNFISEMRNFIVLRSVAPEYFITV